MAWMKFMFAFMMMALLLLTLSMVVFLQIIGEKSESLPLLFLRKSLILNSLISPHLFLEELEDNFRTEIIAKMFFQNSNPLPHIPSVIIFNCSGLLLFYSLFNIQQLLLELFITSQKETTMLLLNLHWQWLLKPLSLFFFILLSATRDFTKFNTLKQNHNLSKRI